MTPLILTHLLNRHLAQGIERAVPAGARRAASQLGGRLRGVATPDYRSADCIPNKDCMRTWFEGVPLRLRRWVSTVESRM